MTKKEIIKLHFKSCKSRTHHALQKKLTAFDTDADKVENQNGKVGTEVFTRPSSYILKIKIDESICRFMHHIFID